VKYTEHPGHATLIARDVVQLNSYDCIVAVGGDGSVNEVAKGLIDSDIELGIIPAGSGNGFARHLGIPLNMKDAIESINTKKSKLVDTGIINKEQFVGIAGLGFDAFISKKFDESNARGFWTYLKLTIREFLTYKEREYHVTIDGENSILKAFMVCFCNSSQWGNDVFIAPNANTQDGFLRMIVVRKLPLLSVPLFAYKLFRRKVNSSKYIKEFKVKSVSVKQSEKLIHIDGEPLVFCKELDVSAKASSLKVIY
jgi:YegS/Rv2252/BmrU family lipid kinase